MDRLERDANLAASLIGMRLTDRQIKSAADPARSTESLATAGVREAAMRRAERQGSALRRKGSRRQAVHKHLLTCVLTFSALFIPLALASGAQATPGQITEFPTPTRDSDPMGIAAGPEGNLWFTESGGNKIGRITPGGQITEFPLPSAESRPDGITAGPDENLWFTESGGNKIGRITPGGQITEFAVAAGEEDDLQQITAGPDGNLWFTERTNEVGRITPTGHITQFPLPAAKSRPDGITAGPDGNLWFTEWEESKIGRITPGGQITEFRTPTRDSDPMGIAAGPDGNLWFTDWVGDKIGRITPGGQITEFPLPSAESKPYGITAGPDGNLWFTESGVNKIGRITPGGQITEFPLPSGVARPYYPIGITAGPEGNLWFTWYSPPTSAEVVPLSPFMEEGEVGYITPGLLGIEFETGSANVHHGMAKLILGCAGGQSGSICEGQVHLSLQIRQRSAAIAVAHAPYSVRSDKNESITLRLRPHALGRLSRLRRLTVQATASVFDGQGSSREVTLDR